MTAKTRKVLALGASIAYAVLVVLFVGSVDYSSATVAQVGIALLFGAAFAYLLPSKWRISVAIVGGVTVVLPFLVLFFLGMPIYKTAAATWRALGDPFVSQMALHPFEVAAATLSPICAAAVSSFGVSYRILKST